jgi:hypothetical protein
VFVWKPVGVLLDWVVWFPGCLKSVAPLAMVLYIFGVFGIHGNLLILLTYADRHRVCFSKLALNAGGVKHGG